MTDVARAWYLTSETDGVPLVILGLSEELVLVGPAYVRWEDPARPSLSVEEVRVLPRHAVDEGLPSESVLDAAVREAVTKRRRRFRRCRECDRMTAPESREGSLCHSCMEDQGVVF